MRLQFESEIVDHFHQLESDLLLGYRLEQSMVCYFQPDIHRSPRDSYTHLDSVKTCQNFSELKCEPPEFVITFMAVQCSLGSLHPLR